MATGCSYGARRLSDLLKEQQEPFLVVPQRRSPVESGCGRRLRKLLCGGGGYKTTARKALLLQWHLVAGCFTCAARRQRFRRLPRAAGEVVGDVSGELNGGGGDALDCGRQVSPVSVLELHSDDESTVLSSHWDEENDGRKPSTLTHGDEDDDLPAAGAAAKPCSTTFVITNGKVRAEAEGNDSKRLQRKSGAGEHPSVAGKEQAIVTEWERIVADISRIPTLVALDLLTVSAREWRRVVAGGEEETRRVGQSIEAMIFEEVRWEAVRDIICLPASANSDL